MPTKLADAIITGPMARPSRPSVRFTALPAPTMMKAAKIGKNQPRLMTRSLNTGNTSEVAKAGRPRLAMAMQAAASAMPASIASREHAGKTRVGLPRHLEVIVIEADQAEAERHRQHDPDIWVARIGPEQSRDDDARQDHQPAHGRRAGLGEDVRLRAVGADRLALALAQPQMIDDPRAEHEHEHQRGDHRARRPHGEIAEHVEERQRAGKVGQPVEHRINPERTPLRRRLATETDG